MSPEIVITISDGKGASALSLIGRPSEKYPFDLIAKTVKLA